MEILRNNESNNNPIVFGVFEEETTVCVDDKLNKNIEVLLKDKLIKLGVGEVNKVYTFGIIEAKEVYVIGLGKKEDYNIVNLAKAAKSVTRKLGDKITVLLDTFVRNLDEKEAVKTFILTMNDYDYKFEECKSKKDETIFDVQIASSKDYSSFIEELFILASAINNTRDLVNKPYNYLNASDLASYANNLVKELDNPNVSIKILNKEEIKKLKMNAFLGVNQGSTDEPKLIHLKYQGKDDFSDPIALIGKGVMFDTGGYSLKQTMNNMKDDMGGSATVLGVFEAAVKNNLKVNLQVVIAATDNRVSGHAYLPDDVLTAMNGKTIEIVSTDAEGRLTLADALTYAQKEGSKRLIDLATLTGAVVVALGDYTTGIFGNDKDMINDIIQNSSNELEHVWELPITEHIRTKVRGSKVADLTNSTGRAMGASGAAAFLEEFVEDGSKWVHLDIAGTAFRTTPSYGEYYGASGVMVKTLYQYLKNLK
ncbi:MAG: leucyl aminopeptidase [Bacilli bacterium]